MPQISGQRKPTAVDTETPSAAHVLQKGTTKGRSICRRELMILELAKGSFLLKWLSCGFFSANLTCAFPITTGMIGGDAT